MNELYEVAQGTQPLKTCPVLIRNQDPFDPEGFGYTACGSALEVMCTRTLMADDYGEIPQYGVYFDCGHSFKEMEEGLKWSEYI